MFRAIKLIGLSVLVAFLPLAAASAADRGKEDVVAVVRGAIDYYKANGKTKALALLSTKDNPFGKGEAYVDVHDLNGVCLAHPNQPGIIGISRLEQADPAGKYVYKDIIAEVKAGKKSGWIDYMRKNPVDGKIEKKTAYWELHDGLIFKAGTYATE
jgi:signal transduction histidine kinase